MSPTSYGGRRRISRASCTTARSTSSGGAGNEPGSRKRDDATEDVAALDDAHPPPRARHGRRIEPRGDDVFRRLPTWSAFNVRSGQVVVGSSADGIGVDEQAYLATFFFRASADAAGNFVVEILHDEVELRHDSNPLFYR